MSPASYQTAPPRVGVSSAIAPAVRPGESGKRDSNPRHQPWQGCALPTELFPHGWVKYTKDPESLQARLNNSLACFIFPMRFGENIQCPTLKVKPRKKNFSVCLPSLSMQLGTSG